MLAQVVGRLADLALARQEDEDVARPFAPEFVHRVGDGVFEIGVLALFLEGRQRCSTGNRRPDTMITGAGPWRPAKWRAKRSASMVAEVTTIFRSGRRGRICRR